ncbi:MAG: RelA/SpoT family protein [Burkholderiaceae bacterium]
MSEPTLLAQAHAWRQSQDWQSAGWSSEQAFLAAGRTADWVASLGLDEASQAACLIYPVALQRAVSDKALIARGGEDVAGLLKGFDRLASMRGQLGSGQTGAEPTAGRQDQIETLRRMILALSDDIRVVIARLAFHQVRLEDMAQALRQDDETGLHDQALQLGQETMLVQAPLANRLGIWQLKWAMEDLAFRFTQPKVYKQIAAWLDEKRSEREAFVQRTISALNRLMQEAGLQAQVAGRPKHLYSIYNKMRQKTLAFDDLRDLRAFRILVKTQSDCYEALAQLHAAYRPMTDEFDDYIVRPKPNGYQSLHTVLLDEQDRPFEVQIRTHDMHLRAEYGVAAHWRYKETGGSAVASSGSGPQAGHEQQIQWLRQMLDWGHAVGQVRLSSDRIYVLTPQARIVELAAGATALDFAYALHTELGHRCRGAKADGQIITLQTPLATGQTIELLTVKLGTPSRDWLQPELGYLKTNRARSKVRAYFNALEAEEKGASAPEAGLPEDPAPTSEALAAHEQEVEQTLMARVQRTRPTAGKGQVLVVGVDRMRTHFAKCCRPLPPDPITGFVTRGRGVTVHRAQCPTLARMMAAQPDRVIETSWGSPPSASSASSGARSTYAVGITLRADRRDGFMRLMTETLIKERVSLGRLTTHQTSESLTLSAEVQVEDAAQLDHCLTALRGLPGVRSVVRD